jgi:hypothetical protein
MSRVGGKLIKNMPRFSSRTHYDPSTIATTCALAILMSLFIISGCDSFDTMRSYSPSRYPVVIHRASANYYDDMTNRRRRAIYYVAPSPRSLMLHLFRELLSDDEEDLRTNVDVIDGRDDLDAFLGRDNRPCVIK